MTLRTRLAAAVGLYVAVRADLRGEIDSALRARARSFTAAPVPGGPGAGGPGAGGPGAGGRGLSRRGQRPSQDGGPGGFPGSVQPVPFGGASGYVQFIAPDGTVEVPGGQGVSPTRIAATPLDLAIASRGGGSSLSDRNVNGTQLRVLTTGTGSAGAVMIAQPLTDVEHELSSLLLILALIGAGGIVLA